MPSHSRPKTLRRRIPAFAVDALAIAGLMIGHLGHAAAARAQDSAETATFTEAELEELVAPIALYPDELLGLALPASTYPLQIVQASRFLEKRAANADLEPDEEWDTSILGLLNYPEVVEKMNEDLDWTWELGEAVANQQGDVMAAVQSFRAKVDAAGNLKSNDQMTVGTQTDEGKKIIVIESASPEVIYVPSYKPATVVVYQTTPYPYYYSPPYPYYYSPAAAFWTGMFVGAAVGYGLSWGHHHHGGYGSIHVHHDIDVNRNVNRNRDVNRDRNVNRDRSGKRESWNADKNRGKQSGSRPGRQNRATETKRAGAKPKAGASATTRPNAGSKSRPSGSTRPANPSAGTKRASTTRDRSARGRDATRSTTSRGSSRNSSLGSYGNGSRSRATSSRGSASRRSSVGGGRGGGGARAGGGGRRR